MDSTQRPPHIITMEFACAFVYVPPSLSQKERPNPNVFKRSALLPPVNRIHPRPRSPPPPPPVPGNPATVKPPNPPPLSSKQESENSKDVKVLKNSVFYDNAEIHIKLDPVSSIIPQQTSSSTKTALLPPHMKPSSKSCFYDQPLTYPHTVNREFTYDLPKKEPDFNAQPWDPNYAYNVPEGTGSEVSLPADPGIVSAPAPAIPPRPEFMNSIPEYLMLLPLPPSPPSSSQKSPPSSEPTTKGSAALTGNPNVVLVSLGKLLSEESVQPMQGEPSFCSCCGSVVDTCYDNVVDECYFCSFSSTPSLLQSPLNGYQDNLFLLNPNEKPLCDTDPLLLFCIDVSGSMGVMCQGMSGGERTVYKSRLQFVQEAVSQCVERLSEQQPGRRVGLVSFNHQVTIHSFENFSSRCLSGAELIESLYLKEVAATFPSPPPLSQTKDCLQSQVMSLSPNGATALGPAALLAIAIASRQPGSKVIICTDGKANTKLGNLEEDDNNACTSISSTIFYQELGEFAANQGVTVSVLSIEGTDCRLDELGKLADRTRGKVVIASPSRLHPEFEQIIQNQTIATHCAVILLLPKSMCMKGEKEAGHKATREVGNVDPHMEITFQFRANEQDSEVPPPASGSRVSVQLQIRYRQKKGQTMLRVLTTDRDVTDDSSAVLSSLSLAIIQLNSSQASAALAVRGRFLNARREGEMQMQLIERAIEYNSSAEDKQIYQEWVKTMEPIYNNMFNFTQKNPVLSDSQPLTDAAAALFYTMKQSNRKSISLKNEHKL